MLVDTDILIWYLRGHIPAATFLRTHQPVTISVVTYMELIQGVRNKEELQALRKTIQRWKWQVLPLHEAISNRAALYVEEYCLSHGMRLADALTAATAIEHGLPLASGNVKHYRMLNDLTLVEFDPRSS